jgi:hypothetical protein
VQIPPEGRRCANVANAAQVSQRFEHRVLAAPQRVEQALALGF